MDRTLSLFMKAPHPKTVYTNTVDNDWRGQHFEMERDENAIYICMSPTFSSF